MKKYIVIIWFILVVLSVSCSTNRDLTWHNANFTHATERTESLVRAINENRPREIYGYLTQDLRERIGEDAFVSNYQEDCTYPYLTPLYLFLAELTLPQRNDGLAVCTVASRLEGEEYTIPIRYENGDYYFFVFKDIVDGSYKDKFANKVVKWI
ncbi:hypothetical protein SpiGrapes_1774 [Sphaerochaeta pleomorpha str. Grapes]|uniref:Uncharacterized protein n=1 Tax=Sphaerochaeta pleomorpha (strain ATCC BAA-1885 / DSM 22778 / Grapes) TaxID=158190 RepID=G8QXK7_SPHPG|nr:hypothetical protein [Sphaerochaeta pleomorpha]AEV29570.1 hypothetical protein SpiGrapes_1774 [Sphaerochaeta pleomorpha str. Grapes]